MSIDLLINKLLDKSQEAFVIAIELYNKPTIKYRVEGFSFFICNAWELMLKAFLIKKDGESGIYFKRGSNRTISLDVCIQRVFTNDKAPLRKNLEQIIELRNTAVHFIVEEYEQLYVPLFQACVFNYIAKMKAFHDIDITQLIPANFLTLPVKIETVTEETLRAKYPQELSEPYINKAKQLIPIINSSNQNYAIQVQHSYYITKDKEEATALVRVTNTAGSEVQIVRELKDPNLTHKYNMKNAIYEINKRLQSLNISFSFNKYHFNKINEKFKIKENTDYCYIHRQNKQPSYSYSTKVIEFIVELIKEDPINFVDRLKK